MRHGLDDVSVGQPGLARLIESCRPKFPALHHNTLCQFQDGVSARIHCRSRPGIGEVLLRQAQLTADERMGAEAIGAAIGLGDGERNLFAELRRKASVPKGGAEVEIALERSRSVAQDANQIRDHA